MSSALFSESDLRAALAHWPDSGPHLEGKSTSDSLMDRLLQCLRGLVSQSGTATFVDLIALLRHWLLSQSRGGQARWLEVPLASPWPSSKVWNDQGFEVADMAHAPKSALSTHDCSGSGNNMTCSTMHSTE